MKPKHYWYKIEKEIDELNTTERIKRVLRRLAMDNNPRDLTMKDLQNLVDNEMLLQIHGVGESLNLKARAALGLEVAQLEPNEVEQIVDLSGFSYEELNKIEKQVVEEKRRRSFNVNASN